MLRPHMPTKKKDSAPALADEEEPGAGEGRGHLRPCLGEQPDAFVRTHLAQEECCRAIWQPQTVARLEAGNGRAPEP